MTFKTEPIDDQISKRTVDPVKPIIIGPFRFVEPYPFTFRCGSKGRWFGRKLIDVFAQEFKHWDRSVLISRIKKGDITVNGKPIPIDYVIREHDVIEHSIIRKESPVYNQPITKLGEMGDYVAFLKPASVPIHATGGYNYNAMVKRLDQRYYPVHRLDRVTSGIIVMGKTEDAARRFGQYLESHKIEKTYVARVVGEFPEGETKVDAPIRENSKDRSFRECGEGGKQSLTLFERVATNGNESIVKCHPITGRTHQIRVHLAFLGHPISNDSMYGGKYIGLTSEEQEALKEAEKKGLWPPDTSLEEDNRAVIFGIYLQSIHYKSDEFDFSAPMPEWADLNYSPKYAPEKAKGFFGNCVIC
ncbi:RNA pseudourine synthase 7 [Tritrichomonas foetus]|uniref:Pseudouridine synthase n=1 Tax=Tritrichomonas foetus TaxID=1144522 RepID=A0A1J4JSM5_9EUKA|nr:RNA pseudourine synthase 7 [Tritrichomonas foetus]|eukprot:OHT02105.1 RNA pseudourine synthase 7 [Tritrichomonas foetus]